MPNRVPTSHPESLNAVWRAVHGLEDEFKKLHDAVDAPSRLAKVLSWFWKERNWAIPTSLAVLGAFATGIYYLGAGIYSVAGLRLDAHINKAIEPLQKQIEDVDGATKRIEGTLSVLQAQIVAMKYSSVRPKELKGHVDELKDVKKNLATAKSETPNFWPASFQIITLASQATAVIRENLPRESSLDSVTSNPPGLIQMDGRRVVLKNLVGGVVFKNCIVRFDPSVKLANDVFYNYVFLFPLEQNPPRPLQEIGRTLLASDLSKVSISAS